MAGSRRGNPLVFAGITFFHGKRLLPVLPILIFQKDRDGRSDGRTMTDTREDVDLIDLDLHATTATVALLPPPQFTVQKRLIYLQSGRQAGKEGDQAITIRLSRSEVAKHRLWIVSDAA